MKLASFFIALLLLLASGCSSPQRQSTESTSPVVLEQLADAVYNRSQRVVIEFLDTHPELTQPDQEGRYVALEMALRSAREDLIAELVKRGVDLNSRDQEGCNPLEWALEQNIVPAGLLALLEQGADPNLANDQGRTALFAAVESQRLPEVTLLLKHGAKVEVADREGITPLHLAAAGHEEMIDLLLHHGAQLESVDHQGRNAAHHAIVAGRPECLALLIARGVEVEASLVKAAETELEALQEMPTRGLDPEVLELVRLERVARTDCLTLLRSPERIQVTERFHSDSIFLVPQPELWPWRQNA